MRKLPQLHYVVNKKILSIDVMSVLIYAFLDLRKEASIQTNEKANSTK